MSLFNRLVTVVVLLATGTAAVLLVLLATGLVPVTRLATGAWSATVLAPIPALQGAALAWTVAIGIAGAILAALLLALEIRSLTRPAPRLVLSEGTSGRVSVTIDSLRELSTREALEIAGVRDARARVRANGTGVHIDCGVVVDGVAPLPQLAGEVQRRVATRLEHAIGEPIAAVSVAAQLTPFPSARVSRRIR